MPTAAVRCALLDDLKGIVPLFDSYRQFYRQPSAEAAVRAFLRSRLDNLDSVILLAEAGARAVGFTQLYPSFSSIAMARTFVLNDLFVVPEARRSGVGRSLLAAAVRHAQEVGAIRLSLATAVTNEAGQALYQAADWQRDTEFLVYHHGLGR